MNSDETWSEWLDFDKPNIDAVPELSGVCVTHANMKVLYIGGSQNIRKTLLECLSDPCTGKAKRFRYALLSVYQSEKDKLLKEYAEKHGGKLPACMEGKAL